MADKLAAFMRICSSKERLGFILTVSHPLISGLEMSRLPVKKYLVIVSRNTAGDSPEVSLKNIQRFDTEMGECRRELQPLDLKPCRLHLHPLTSLLCGKR